MVISYFGTLFCKIVFGDTTIAVNPVSRDSSQKSVRFGADIALVSVNDKDFNGVDQVAHGDRQPFIIWGPGEYEIQNVFIKGFPSVSAIHDGETINTMYTMVLEGMTLCFLGALGSKKIPPEIKEALTNIDVLFLPVGEKGTLTPSAAHELSVSLEAKIVIPTLLGSSDTAKKNLLKKFLDEDGSQNIRPIDKLTLKKRDLENKQGEIVVLGK
jgi:L-ascorbate metabolism protein UlaG (beta-lactamase superfamily)